MPAGMSESAEYAWRNAERRVFDYIVAQTGYIEGASAFLAELPKALPATADVTGFSFAITGVPDAEVRPRPFWRFAGMIDGFFSNRIDAQRFVGKVMQALPVTHGTVEGVELVRISSFELRRGTRSIDEDLGQGGEARVWFLEMSVEVVALNSTPEA
jgi:hypothetical protein